MAIISVRTGHPQQKAMRRLLLIGQMLYPVHPAAPALLHSGDGDQGPFTSVLQRADLPVLTTTCFLDGPWALAVAASRSTIGTFSLAEILLDMFLFLFVNHVS
jgi:hypothetical protein